MAVVREGLVPVPVSVVAVAVFGGASGVRLIPVADIVSLLINSLSYAK